MVKIAAKRRRNPPFATGYFLVPIIPWYPVLLFQDVDMTQDMNVSLFHPGIASQYLHLWIGNTIKCENIDQVECRSPCLTVCITTVGLPFKLSMTKFLEFTSVATFSTYQHLSP